MDIHTMMANAAADVRAMELRIVHLQDEVQRVNLDNERLRQENASITAARMHAEADLVHYQNVFVASVCVEAGSICREFFNLTQEKVRERAEGAIQKYVEERVKAERDKEYPPTPALGQSDDPDYEEFDKSIEEGPAKPAEVQDTNTTPETYSKKPTMTLRERAAKLKGSNTKDHPIPSFLTEPKKEEPSTSFGSMIATLGL